MALAAALNLSLILIDIVNAYQNTLLESKDMTYVYALPFYKA